MFETIKLKDFLQPNRPQRRELDSEEDSDGEQLSAYQKLLSTMIQGADDNSEDEESEDEDDGEEVEDENDGEEVEGKVSYFLIFVINCGASSERA